MEIGFEKNSILGFFIGFFFGLLGGLSVLFLFTYILNMKFYLNFKANLLKKINVFGSLLLTSVLGYLYFSLSKTQKKQTKILSNQQDIMKGHFKPKLTFEKQKLNYFYISKNNYCEVLLENIGQGVAKDVCLITELSIHQGNNVIDGKNFPDLFHEEVKLNIRPNMNIFIDSSKYKDSEGHIQSDTLAEVSFHVHSFTKAPTLQPGQHKKLLSKLSVKADCISSGVSTIIPISEAIQALNKNQETVFSYILWIGYRDLLENEYFEQLDSGFKIEVTESESINFEDISQSTAYYSVQTPWNPEIPYSNHPSRKQFWDE